MTYNDKIEPAQRDPIAARWNGMAPARFSFMEGIAMIASPGSPQRHAATNGMSQSLAASAAARKRRQDDLLDEALLETFPASDPVSVVHVE